MVSVLGIDSERSWRGCGGGEKDSVNNKLLGPLT